MYRKLTLVVVFSAIVIGALCVSSPPLQGSAHHRLLPASPITAIRLHAKTLPPVVAPVVSTTTTSTTTTTTLPAPVAPPTTAPAPPPMPTPAVSGGMGGWTKVAVCEEGGWGHNGFSASYIGDLGISRVNWYNLCADNCTDLSPANQIAVASRIQTTPPDQNGCAAW